MGYVFYGYSYNQLLVWTFLYIFLLDELEIITEDNDAVTAKISTKGSEEE